MMMMIKKVENLHTVFATFIPGGVNTLSNKIGKTKNTKKYQKKIKKISPNKRIYTSIHTIFSVILTIPRTCRHVDPKRTTN